MPVDAWDFTGRLECIQIENRDAGSRAAARNIQAAANHIRVDVVKAAIAANLDRLQNFVRARCRGLLSYPRDASIAIPVASTTGK